METNAKIIMPTKEVNIMQAGAGASNRTTTKRAAADRVDMTERHFYRCYDKWVEGGEQALAHKARGVQGNYRYSEDMRAGSIKNTLMLK